MYTIKKLENIFKYFSASEQKYLDPEIKKKDKMRNPKTSPVITKTFFLLI